jgi:cupin fold WbuC family metalloprotein
MKARRIRDEVFVADEPVVKVARDAIETLKCLAGGTARRRVRLCAHRQTADTLHEMLIVLHRGTYVRPHRHVNKSESFHIIEGTLMVVLFSDQGAIREVIPMGSYTSGRHFYYRLAKPTYHTVLLETEQAVIHETTNGPFNPHETEFAPWSPAENDAVEAARYQAELLDSVERGKCPVNPL